MGNFTKIFHKNSQKGVSTFELLVCGPALVALLYFAFEINQRLENTSFSAIVARNALLTHVDDVTSLTASRNALAEQLLPESRKNGSLQAPELKENGKQLLTKTAQDKNFLNIQSEGELDIKDLFSTIQAGANVEIKNLAYRKTIAKVSSAEAKIIDLTYPLISPARNILEVGYGTNLTKRLRSSSTEYQFDYENHALVRSLAMLSSAVGSDQATIQPTFNAYGRSYLEELNGYHLNDTIHPALIGAPLGFLLKRQWNAESSFSTSSSKFQTRCMNRLTMEDTCEGTPKGQRIFVQKIAVIATARQVLSAALIALAFPSYGATEAIEDIFVEVVSTIIDEVTKNVLNKIAEELQRQVEDTILNKVSPENLIKAGPLKEKLAEFDARFTKRINEKESP